MAQVPVLLGVRGQESGGRAPGKTIPCDLPLDFEGIVTKALQKDRRNRYQHTDEMLDDLRSLGGTMRSRTAVSSLLETRTIVALPAAAAECSLC